MYDNILVPTDGSDTVLATLEHALSIATDNEATVHALSVVDTRVTAAADSETRPALTETLEKDAQAAVTTVTDQATDANLRTVQAVHRGTPAKEILTYAEEAGIDLIVIGTHGKTPREKLAMGSVSERVVDQAEIPVLVVRGAGVDR